MPITDTPDVLDLRNSIMDLLDAKFGAPFLDVNWTVGFEHGSILAELPDGRPVNVQIYIGSEDQKEEVGFMHFGVDLLNPLTKKRAAA